MPRSPVKQALVDYARLVRQDLSAATAAGIGPAVEPTLHDRFRTLLENLLPAIFPAGGAATLPNVLVEYNSRTIGRPDIALAHRGQFAKSFVELKIPSHRLNPNQLRGHDKEQFERFCDLPVWGYSNFYEIHLYRRSELVSEAQIIPRLALDPTTSDARAETLIDVHDPTGFAGIVEALVLAQPPVPRSAEEVATSIAHAARLIRGVVLDLARGLPPGGALVTSALYLVREEFRDVLYARPTAGGHGSDEEFSDLFASAFAQTLAYGLLLARESSGREVGHDAYNLINHALHPLLAVTLQALLQPQITNDLGGALQVLLDAVNVVDPALLTRRPGSDPILYFYEDFIAVFDRKTKDKYGIFYTPVEVVKFQVAEVDRVLRDELKTDGLLDATVHVLDPATGTGTYLVAATAAAADRARTMFGGAAVPAELRSLASRLYGLEILVGPYAVAHFRLHRELSDIGAALGGRLNVFLADTLAPAEGTERVTPHLAFLSGPIVMERRLADEVKSSRPILAIIGNPPYRRLAEGETAELVSRWVAEVLWEDFKRPVRNAGWGGELNTFPDLYVAFYRWALWKLFERPGADGRGVLCFITNRSFLTGHPYAGVRQVLRQRFSEIRIVDLRGDNRAPRPAGIEEDQCVFNIEAGVCILIAYADGNPQNGQLGIVSYADIWEHGCFTKADKLRFLEECAAGEGQLNFVGIDRGPLDDFRPRPFEGKAWPSLEHLFLDKSLGVQTKRDDFVYRPTRRLLEDSIRNALTSSNPEQYQDRFNDTGMRSFSRARLHPFDVANVRVISYRPLDRRYLYDHAAFIDRPRPLLRSLWGASNVGLYTLPAGVGKGPAVVVCGHLPDYHAFRGSYGGYAFPLDDRRPGGHPFNLAAALIESLSRLYGYSVEAPEVFDFVVGVLSATSYSRRFASDLQDAFPHVPFPRDGAHFRFVAGIGARIRQLEAFQARPDQRYQTARLEGTAIHHVIDLPTLARCFVSTGSGLGTVHLKPDGFFRLENVSEGVWAFEVSGYRVLYRWLEARNHLELDRDLQRELLDLVARVAELLELFDQVDAELPAILIATLTVQELGLVSSTLI